MTTDADVVSKISKAVIDASVALKWFAFEPDTPKARAVFQRILEKKMIATAPDLLFYEVANSLWKGKKLEPKVIVSSLETLNASGMQFERLNQLSWQTAIGLMTAYNLTFYDAVYLGLAKLLDVPLLTADLKYYKKVKGVRIIAL